MSHGCQWYRRLLRPAKAMRAVMLRVVKTKRLILQLDNIGSGRHASPIQSCDPMMQLQPLLDCPLVRIDGCCYICYSNMPYFNSAYSVCLVPEHAASDWGPCPAFRASLPGAGSKSSCTIVRRFVVHARRWPLPDSIALLRLHASCMCFTPLNPP